ncbi:MAG: efflux RND transporter periplasmic adaptor subunit [Acidobacteriota bacterium]
MPEVTPNPEALDQLFDQTRSRRRWPWLLGVAAVLALLLLAFSPRQSPTSSFDIVELQRRDLVATVSATGQLQPTLQVQVGSEISGTVVDVLVDSNDVVKAGQVLARIDTTKLEQQTGRSRASWQSARAQQEQAEASLEEAAAQLQRFEEVFQLSGGKVPSQTELDAARASEERARAGVAAAEAAVAEARAATRSNETDLQKSVIRSPIDGIVLDRDIDPGQTVAASFQAPILFTIGQDLSVMDLTVYVSEADIAKVEEGQGATFTVDAWPTLEFGAAVTKVSFGSETVDNVVSYETELEVPNDEAKLRPGMTATAAITVAQQQDVLVVPNAALRFTPPAKREGGMRGGFSFLPKPPSNERQGSSDESVVYVLKEESLLRVPVETGLSDGRWTEVRGAELSLGDEVVVDILEADS